MGKLTAKGVAALNEPGRYADGDGLYLRVTSPEKKYWILRIQSSGVRKDYSLGPASRVTLAEARAAAAKLRKEVEEAPIIDGRVAEGRRWANRRVPTFEEVAKTVQEQTVAYWRNGKHRDQWINTLTTYAFPVIGQLPIDKVTRREIFTIMQPIWGPKHETARRVMQRIDAVIKWAVATGLRDDSIDMTLVRAGLPKMTRNNTHMASIPWEDMPSFWRLLETSRSEPLIRMAIKWMILTVPRPNNVSLFEASQVDLVKRIWTIPEGQMKVHGNGDHVIPLSQAALDIFEQAVSISGGAYVFSRKLTPFSADTMRMAMRRMDLEATPHGFRSSFKDWSLVQGWPDHLSERALAHTDKDRVRAAYARTDLVEARRPMMEAWAAYVTGQQ